jgi:hypothetical protein
MRRELFGLPGVGKSTIISKLDGSDLSPPEIVAGPFRVKLVNILRGISKRPAIIFFMVFDVPYCMGLTTLWRYLVLFERIGRVLKLNNHFTIDEGPLQAIWALFHNRQNSSLNEKKFQSLLKLGSICEVNIYISTNENNYRRFASSRARTHSVFYADKDGFALAKYWLNQMVLIQSKSETVELLTQTNNWNQQYVD